MNLSKMVTRIKLKLGIFNIATPIEDLDNVIVDILKDITLPVFSIYSPYKEEMIINTKHLQRVDYASNFDVFLLPDFSPRKLLSVEDVNYDDSFLTGLGYTGAYPLMTANTIQNVMMANAAGSMMNQITPKMTFKFIAPRKLIMYDMFTSCTLRIKFAFEHDKSFASIPETASETFFNLALLDVMSNLYPTMKQYSNLSTVIGNIDLKIDDWADADSRRNDLLQQWDDSYLLDGESFYWL